ncbi:MAG TPA: hypothetical protein VNW92_02375 [Polyangiaceae bacterium]|nr:hypothetical protein [Polyangiaceae bacterium]
MTDANSNVVALDHGCGTADCSSCTPTACPPIACFNQTVPAEGVTRQWDETQWLGSTCGMSAMMCTEPVCVPPGKYKAKMCTTKNTAAPSSACVPGNTPVCTEVSFDLPGNTVVQGTVGG